MADTRTARDLITSSLKRLGVIAGIETPTSDLAVDGLDRLRDLLATWSTESLTMYAQDVVETAGPVLVSKPVYTIGPGGDLDLPARPPWIDHVTTLLIGTPNYEITLAPVSRQHWQRERQKLLTSAIPTAVYYEPTWPLGELTLWPGYSGGQILRLRVYVPLPVPLATLTLDTVLDFPPGYYRALRDTLALELAPEVGRPADQLLLKIATDAKAQLERINLAPIALGMPATLPGQVGGYDWRTDEGG